MSYKSGLYVDHRMVASVAQLLHTLGSAMPIEKYSLMDGKLHVYKRAKSRFWQCSTYLLGVNFRKSTKEETLTLAKEYAQDWYMRLYAEVRRRKRDGDLYDPHAVGIDVGTDRPSLARPRRTPKGPTFKAAADEFLKEFEVNTQGERNAKYVSMKRLQVDVHLMPFFGGKGVQEITAGLVQEYRSHRLTSRIDKKTGQPKRPARSTLHSEMVTLRQILKTANRKGWIAALPDMSVAYKASGKISHRAWFSPDEYKMLYEATRERALHPKKERWRRESENLHDFVLFMANTGLRPDEAARLEYRDVTIIRDENHGGEKILEIEVRGKRGIGFCKSMPGAVMPFERLRKRSGGKPTDPVFGKIPREILNNVLDELNLKFDRDGNLRTAYSLRHTYICLRLMEGADIYQVAKNCRTSVEMIEKYYASHIRTSIDTAAVNVRREKKMPPAVKQAARNAKAGAKKAKETG